MPLNQLDALLARYDGPVGLLVATTRTFLLANIPALIEEVDPPANMLAYSFGPGYKGSICSIIPSKKEIKLGFYKGDELPDPEQLLEGTGKVHRYVVIRSAQDLKRPALRSLLNLAADACRARLSGA